MSATRESARNESLAPITVLHVDDNPQLVEMTKEFLERHLQSASVRTATDPQRALDAGLEDVDCIISDYDMPTTDGLEFLKSVREKHSSLPFILFTGKGSERVASEAIEAGVTGYLQKGSGTEQYELLCQQIENAVERQRARKNYRELFEKTPVGLTIHDPETGVVTDSNQTFADFLGYEPEELVGTHPGELSPPESSFTRKKANQLIRQTIEEGSQTFEWRDNTKDGDVIWVEVTLKQTYIDGRQRVLAVIQDITERKQRERKLEREKNRFEAIFEHSNDAIFVLDPENDTIEDVNTQAEQLLEYTREELLTKVSISDIHPDHIEEFRGFIQRVQEEGAGWTDNFCCLTKSGDERNVEISAAAIEHEDDQYLLANIRDISERIEREQELEQIRERIEFVLEATNAVIWERNPETGTITTHPDPCPVLDGSIETAADFREKIHPDAISNFKQSIQEVTDRRESNRVEFRTASDVTADWVETRIEPITDEDGSVKSLVGIARDITDQKQREQDLQRQNERLDEFASIVSHDVQTHLSVAEGRLDLARNDCENEHLAHVKQALDRMDTLVKDILTLAREGDKATEIETIDLVNISKSSWQTMDTADATLVIESDQSIRADRNKLQQLLENLFQNAIEHGGKSVTVRIGHLTDRSGFYVEDDGPGISAEEREQVFETGYTTTPEGTGFGLRIVEQIAEAHGWKVTVTESDSSGARFEFSGADIKC